MIRNPPKDSIGDFWGPSLYYVFRDARDVQLGGKAAGHVAVSVVNTRIHISCASFRTPCENAGEML